MNKQYSKFPFVLLSGMLMFNLLNPISAFAMPSLVASNSLKNEFAETKILEYKQSIESNLVNTKTNSVKDLKVFKETDQKSSILPIEPEKTDSLPASLNPEKLIQISDSKTNENNETFLLNKSDIIKKDLEVKLETKQTEHTGPGTNIPDENIEPELIVKVEKKEAQKDIVNIPETNQTEIINVVSTTKTNDLNIYNQEIIFNENYSESEKQKALDGTIKTLNLIEKYQEPNLNDLQTELDKKINEGLEQYSKTKNIYNTERIVDEIKETVETIEIPEETENTDLDENYTVSDDGFVEINVLSKDELENLKTLKSENQKKLEEQQNDEIMNNQTNDVQNVVDEIGPGVNLNINVDENISVESNLAIEYASSKLGYKYSQSSRDSGKAYDCSSLVYYSYLNAGVSLGNGDNTAAGIAKDLISQGKEIDTSNLQSGDLIFYSGKRNGRFNNITHVAMYIGDGKQIEASSGRGKVVINDLRLKNAVDVCRVSEQALNPDNGIETDSLDTATSLEPEQETESLKQTEITETTEIGPGIP